PHGAEVLECGYDSGELPAWDRGVQQIEIDRVGAETPKARLTSTRDTISGDLVGLHFGDQEDSLPLAGDYVLEELFGAAVAVISGCIDQRHAQRNACAECLLLDSLRMSSLAEMPAALAERRDGS